MKAPRFPSFFKIPKHKQFELPVRYYNKHKERIKKSLKKYSTEELNRDIEKKHISKLWKTKEKLENYNSSFPIIIIIIFLSIISYFILKY